MPWWEASLDIVALVLLLVVLGFIGLFVRRRWLSRGGSTFECSLRVRAQRTTGSPRGWVLGIGRYAEDKLEWYRVFSFSPRPKHAFERSLTVLGRRTPHGAEAFALHAGHQILDVKLVSGGRIELGMSEPAMTGFLAWTEAGPPGNDRMLA